VSTLAAINPIAYPQLWDHAIIGEVSSPGYCTWSGWKRAHEFDKKKGKGAQGATLTFVQKPPAEGTFTFYLWDDGSLGTGHNHFAEWDAFAQLLKYDPSKKAIKAIAIKHPALDLIDVRNVVCEELGTLEPAGQGLWQVTCKFTEYFPPTKTTAATLANSTPNTTQQNAGKGGAPGAGATPGTEGTPVDDPPTAKDALDKVNDNLDDQIKYTQGDIDEEKLAK
jgi:hypothetical protein